MKDIDFTTLQLLVRENVELDEKLPEIAKRVIEADINYESEEDEVTEAMVLILSQELDSFSDMTQEEIMYSLHLLEISCALIDMQSMGLISEKDGKYKAIDDKMEENDS